ncbi:MAG TPA: hypothetical protein VLC79_12945, partial [Cellvibrio sp.]|nr:hypothetical protein [Cellvibrio sp.]
WQHLRFNYKWIFAITMPHRFFSEIYLIFFLFHGLTRIKNMSLDKLAPMSFLSNEAQRLLLVQDRTKE